MGRRWFPKTLAEWKEPDAFTRWRTAEELRAWSYSSRLATVAAIFGTALLPLIIDRQGLRPPTLEESLGMLLFACTMMAVLVWLFLFTPCTVRITEYGLALTTSQTTILSFADIGSVVPRIREIDGRRFTVLWIERPARPPVEIAVADTLSVARIEEVLRARGVRIGS
jgi:hypothetical protein